MSHCSKEADPHFELKVELWSCALEEELTMANTPKKLAKRLRSSFGKAAGKKLCPLLDSPDPDTFLQYNPIPSYVFFLDCLIKYNLQTLGSITQRIYIHVFTLFGCFFHFKTQFSRRL